MKTVLALAFAMASAVMTAVHADDQPFITLYTTDIDTQYEKEIEQSLYWSTQKPHQAFNGWLSRTEFEYGVTDDFQISGYLNYEWSEAHPTRASGKTIPFTRPAYPGRPSTGC